MDGSEGRAESGTASGAAGADCLALPLDRGLMQRSRAGAELGAPLT